MFLPVNINEADEWGVDRPADTCHVLDSTLNNSDVSVFEFVKQFSALSRVRA